MNLVSYTHLGFHVDGFMDTMDALHSYQPRERKLEILKDSHIGAFSVIKLAEFGLKMCIRDRNRLPVYGAGTTPGNAQ